MTGDWPPTLTPYIVVSDAHRALEWYCVLLGGRQRGVMPDGGAGHAEVGLGDAVLMLAEGSGQVPVRRRGAPVRTVTPCTCRSPTWTR